MIKILQKRLAYYLFFILIPSLAISAATVSLSEVIKQPLEKIKQLIKAGTIDINKKYDNNETILIHASKNGKKDIVQYLVSTHKEKISNYSLGHALRETTIKWTQKNTYDDERKKFKNIFNDLVREVFLRNSKNRELTEFAKTMVNFSRELAYSMRKIKIYEALSPKDQTEESSQKFNKSIVNYIIQKYIGKIMNRADFKKISKLIEEERLQKNQYYTFFIHKSVELFITYHKEEVTDTPSPAEKLLQYLIKLGDIKVPSQEAERLFLDICSSDVETQGLLKLLLNKNIPFADIKNERLENGVMLNASVGNTARLNLIMSYLKDQEKQKKMINAQDKNGMTAVMLACQTQQLNMIKLLVEKYGADVNLVNHNNETALMIVAARASRDHPDVPGLFSEAEDLAIVQYLIKAKANTSTTNEHGATAYTLAKKVQATGGKNQSIVNFLAQQNNQFEQRNSQDNPQNQNNNSNSKDNEILPKQPSPKFINNNSNSEDNEILPKKTPPTILTYLIVIGGLCGIVGIGYWIYKTLTKKNINSDKPSAS